MDWTQYKWNPWSISKRGLLDIEEVLVSNSINHVVEFGSGASSYYIRDVMNRIGRPYHLMSFDDDIGYAAEGVNIRPLLTCSDEHFDEMFNERVYKSQLMQYYTERKHSRQHNCFYKINGEDFVTPIDFLLVDGPNGNGRSFAYLHTKDCLKKGAVVFVDDYDHYDFLDKLSLFHEYTVIKERDSSKDRYIILKIN